jgi:predicted RNA-binding Zn-ribbon protein involved in translation (DUF1610 family)
MTIINNLDIMAEIETEVRTFNIEYECDKCESGNMRKTGNSFSNGAGTYIDHKCSNCGHTETFINKSYPYQIVRPKN